MSDEEDDRDPKVDAYYEKNFANVGMGTEWTVYDKITRRYMPVSEFNRLYYGAE